MAEKRSEATNRPTVRHNRQAILSSPSYVLAEEDIPLLKRDELRAQRLQLEYLKPELALKAHRIESTIVVFGGTRIIEEPEARRRVADLRKELEQHPENAAVRHQLGVAERVLAKAHYYEEARKFAAMISPVCQVGDTREMVVVTGGGPGIMEAANRGAYESGFKSIGLNITLPHEQEPNAFITPELCFQFHYFALRKMHFMMRAKALVAFPGGYGTMDELFEALTLLQTHKVEPIPVVLVGREFWEGAVNFAHFVHEGTIDPEDLDLFRYAETAEEIWDHITRFHDREPVKAK